MNTTKEPALSALPHDENSRTMPLTYIQVVKTIAHLGNRCDSDVVSVRRIQRRLVNEGRDVSLEQIQKALKRAVRAGAIAEVVENRYKVMQSKGDQATRAGPSGHKRVPQVRAKQVVAKPRQQHQLSARGQKTGAIKARRSLQARGKTAGGRLTPNGEAKQRVKPASVVGKEASGHSSRRKLTISAAKQLPASFSADTRLPVSRFKLVMKGKQLMGSKRPVMVVRAVKSSIKLLARALARARGRGRETATKRSTPRTARCQSVVQCGQRRRAERRQRPAKTVSQSGTENSSDPAAGEPSSRGTDRKGQGDSEDDHNDSSSAVSSEENLPVEEPPHEEAPCYQETVSNGYQAVSIFPGWAK